MGATNFPNGVKTYPSSANEVHYTASHTVTAAECEGSTLVINADTQVFLLPVLTGVVGGIVTLVNGRDGQLLTVSPNAADGIAFGNQAVDGVSIVNTAATAKKGDYVTLISVGAAAATHWTVAAIGGVWADFV